MALTTVNPVARAGILEVMDLAFICMQQGWQKRSGNTGMGT